MNMKHVTEIVGCLVLIVSVDVVYSQSIRPVASRASATTQKATADSKYSSLLVTYLKSIEGMERALLAEREKGYQELLVAEQTRIAALAKDEAGVLRGLQEEKAKRKSKKLDFEGEVYENSNSFIFGSSPASARIAKTLLDEGAFRDVGDVIAKLQLNVASDLCKEWVSILKEVRRDSKKDGDLSRLIERLLYRNGQIAYKDALIDQIENKGNAAALEAILFVRNLKTGVPEPIINADNLGLVKQYADTKYSPGVRATCAHYALTVRDYSLSLRVSKELLAQEYVGMKNVDAWPPPKEDSELGRAREAIMLLLFYGHKNEEAFRLVYDRATIEDRERTRVSPIEARPRVKGSFPRAARTPPGDKWVMFTSYVHGQSEVSAAMTLISAIAPDGRNGEHHEE